MGLPMVLDILGRVNSQVGQFEEAAHEVLSHHEASARSRVISLDASRRKLQALSLQQHELLMESLQCVEYGLYRAAHVSAWQALVDFIAEKLAADRFVKMAQARPKWPTFKSVEDLVEQVNEFELIVVARQLHLLSKAEAKTLHGMLSKRNECAHPTSYRPDLNETLGYVSEVINRISRLIPKSV